MSSSTPSTARERIARLIERAELGHQDAIGELLQEYRGYLKAIAHRRMTVGLAGRMDASDLVQQTMLEAHQGLQQFLTEDQEHLRATLRKILTCNVANAIRDHVFTEKRDARRENPESGQLALVAGSLTSPSMNLVRAETAERFVALIDELPEDQATAIRMRYFESASVGEIGAALGRSRGAAAGLLKRGLSEIRRELPAEAV